MAGGYDGTIAIDTSIDAKGMTSGTKKITSSFSSSLSGVMRALKGVATAMALVFAGSTLASLISNALRKFDLMSSSIGGNIKELNTAFDTLTGSFVNLLVTAIAPLIPYVIIVVNWLTSLLSIATQLAAAFFGLGVTVGGIAQKVTTTTKAATGAAKGALAAFDQINVLQKDNSVADANTPTPLTPPAMTVPAGLLKQVEDFKQKMLDFLQPVTDALGRLYIALLPLGQTIWAGLKWAWDNILVPLGTWVITNLLPAFLDLLGSAAGVLNQALIALQPTWQWIWDNLLLPAAQFTGFVIIQALEWLTARLNDLSAWIEANPQKFQTFVDVLLILAGIIFTVGQVASFLSTVLPILELAAAALGIGVGALVLTFIEIIAIIAGLIFIVKNAGAAFSAWRGIISQEIELVKNILKIFVFFFTKYVGEPIASAFMQALENVKAGFKTVFTFIKDFVMDIVNGIIDIISGMVNNIISNINDVIAAAQFVQNLLSGNSDNTQAPQIPTSGVPFLATGAVIPPNSRFAAILGDQKSGVNIEAPADLIRQIVREEMQGGSGGDLTVNMPVYLDNEKIYDGQQKVQIRRGTSLVKSGATL